MPHTQRVWHLSWNYHVIQTPTTMVSLSLWLTIWNRHVVASLPQLLYATYTESMASLPELPCHMPLTSDIKISFYSSSPNVRAKSAITNVLWSAAVHCLLDTLHKVQNELLWRRRPSILLSLRDP